MNKFKFIQSLIENKSFNESQKKMFFMLIAKELEKASDLDDSLLRDIEIIKDKLGIESTRTKKRTTIEKEGESEEKSLKYINPKNLTHFLKAFNENPILNSVCHEIDDELSLKKLLGLCRMEVYDFETHLECIKSEFKKLSKQYQVNKNIFSLINAYINGGSPWSSDNIKMSWSDQILLEWSKVNKRYVPNPGANIIEKTEQEIFRIDPPFNSSLTGKSVSTFSELVILFKSLFHINPNNKLKPLIQRINKERKYEDWANIKISEQKFGDNIRIYTDVDKLIQTYNGIIQLINNVKIENKTDDKPQIELKYYEKEDHVYFTIHYKNTIHNKSLGSTLDHPYGQTLSALIDKRINGLCDLELMGDFDNNEYARINLWNGNEVNVMEELDSFEGVEFILKFYR